MFIGIDDAVVARFPQVRVGAFRVGDLQRVADSTSDAASLLLSAGNTLESEELTVANLTDDPRIAHWRQAFKDSGLKPSTFRSSPEQLGRRLLKGQGISTPLTIVTIYCAVSAKHLAALGAYDVARLPSESITLRPCNPGSDHFEPLAGKAEQMPMTNRVIVYASGSEVICWSFNHRDSRQTCLRETTNEALFMGEAVSVEQYQHLESALGELHRILSDHGAAAGPVRFMDANDRRAVFGRQG